MRPSKEAVVEFVAICVAAVAIIVLGILTQ